MQREVSPGRIRSCQTLRIAGAAGKGSCEIVKKIYVGNLPFSATDDTLSQLFGEHGTVHSVALINDRETGRPRGFGFVEMDDNEAMAAISALNGFEMEGRNLRIKEAEDSRSGGRGSFGGGGLGNCSW
jgi:RNA recognition motif-containing protein